MTAAQNTASALYRLNVYGEGKRVDSLTDDWTYRVAFRAPSEEVAQEAAEVIAGEVEWDYGQQHGWDLDTAHNAKGHAHG
jgi:hypothetical protein